MNQIKKIFFTGLVILAILALLPALIAGSPILVLLVALFSLGNLRPLWRNLWNGTGSVLGGLLSGVGMIFSGLLKSVGWLLGLGKTKNQFMGWWGRQKLLGGHQDGFLVDGHNLRLSEKATYESLLIQGGMGRGKSSTFVMPNLLSLPKHKPSFVITDTSGEVYLNTAGYLTSQSYEVKCLNLIDLAKSETYNPLETCTSPKDVAELAKILVSTSGQRQGGKPSDPFWEQSAEKLIRIMAQCLMNQPDVQYRNLANLRHLITAFDAHTAPKGQLGKIDKFVLSATQSDPQTFASYQAFVQGNLKTIQSVLMSADVALDALAIPEIATLTANNSIQFSDLRQKPTALYILVNQTQMPFYAFLLNLFYTDLFKSLLTNQHNPGRPVWLFLEEFGHLTVDHFETYATTARKYKVGFAMFLQSLAQLEARYGAINAKTIIESIGGEIYLPGMALDTARNLEARLGRIKNAPLMPAHEIIRMKENEALMLQSNNLPIKLKTKRFYQQGTMKRRSGLTVPVPPNRPNHSPSFLPLI